MKYCEKCVAKNGNFDLFVMTLQTSCGAFRHRERVTLQTSCGAERVKYHLGRVGESKAALRIECPFYL